MKKNFLKKLAFVLAFAMVFVTLAPATAANAASTPALSASKKYLLLNDEARTSYDFNIKNKVAGSTYKWTSSNSDVATVDAKNGLVDAAGIGSTTITCKITLATGKTKTLTATVIVKENIETLTITNVPTAAIAIGEVNDFNRSYTTVTTGKTTDITRWEITKGNDAKVATIDAAGKFVSTAAGEFEVVARSFQSAAKYEAYLAGDTTVVTAEATPVTVKVAAAMVGAKQVDLSSVNVTFTDAMTDAAKNLSVYAVVGTTKVKQTVKSVTMDAANKVATVLFYVPFTAGTTYVVDYTDMKSVEFVAAAAEVADVASMVITTTEAVVNTPTDINVKLLNKDGVNITNTVLSNRVALASSSAKAYLNVAAKNVTIFTKGEATTITATFHSYTYDATTGAEIITVPAATSVVTGVDAVTVTVGAVKAWTIENDGTPNYTTVSQKIAAEDSNYRLFVKAIKSDGENYATSEVAGSKFTFTSSNTDTLIINATTGQLYPIKAGSAVVVVKYDGTVIDAVTISIGAKRAATTLTLDTYAFTLSNDVDVADTKTVAIDVIDQFGADVTNASVSINKKDGSASSNLIVGSVAANAESITFDASGTTAGTYYYTVNANGLTRYLVVTVQAPTTQATSSYYKLNLSGTAFDTALTSDDTSEVLTVKLYGYAANNVADAKPAVSGAGYVVVITGPDNFSYTVPANGVLTLAQAVSGSAVTKQAAGSYTVTAYVGTRVLDITYFTVKDSQVAPTVATNKLVTTNAAAGSAIKETLLAAVKECFTVTLNGTDVTSAITVPAASVIGDGATVFIKSVEYVETVAGSTITHTVAVNTTITFAK